MQPSKPTSQRSFSADSSLFWGGIIALGVLGYNLPWLAGAAAGLTFGAYDLAEWVSLHPLVRANALLIESALLRLPPLCLAWIAALHARRMFSWSGLFVFISAVTLLPPLDFLTQRADPNYRQQFLIALATMIGGTIGLSGILGRWRRLLVIVCALAGILTTVAGLRASQELLLSFTQRVDAGAGFVWMITVFSLALAGAILERNKTGM